MKDAAIVLITSQTVNADEAIALNSVISKSVRGRVEGQGSRSESAHREIRMGRSSGRCSSHVGIGCVCLENNGR